MALAQTQEILHTVHISGYATTSSQAVGHVQDHMLDIKFFVNCKVMEIITLTCFIKYRDLIVLSITAILKI